MRVINEAADYKDAGLGTTDWIVNFANAAQVTDPAQISAMRTLYDSCVSAGIWSKIFGIAFFPGSTPATQKYIFNKVGFGESFPEIVFAGNGSGAGGWTPGLGINGVVPFNMPAGNISNFSLGFYNNTAETAPTAGFGRRGMEIVDNTAPVNYSVALTRYFQDTVKSPVASIGLASTSSDKAFPASETYDLAKKGFLQAVKQGNTLRLIDNGVAIASNTNATQVLVGGGTHKLTLGTGMNADGSPIVVNSSKGPSLARYSFMYWGQLSLTEAVAFNAIVNTFVTAMGRV